MKGFTNVSRPDMHAALNGFKLRMDASKKIRDEAVIRYYDTYFPKQMPWNRYFNRNLSKFAFVRRQMGSFGTWCGLLEPVVNDHEYEEICWWSWTPVSDANGLKALHDATHVNGFALVDQNMAEFINTHKKYYEDSK